MRKWWGKKFLPQISCLDEIISTFLLRAHLVLPPTSLKHSNNTFFMFDLTLIQCSSSIWNKDFSFHIIHIVVGSDQESGSENMIPCGCWVLEAMKIKFMKLQKWMAAAIKELLLVSGQWWWKRTKVDFRSR